MFNILDYMGKKRSSTDRNVKKIAEKQLKENKAVIESLRDYDEGKKDIPTADLKRRLQDIRAAL